jgi:hypothetical protein
MTHLELRSESFTTAMSKMKLLEDHTAIEDIDDYWVDNEVRPRLLNANTQLLEGRMGSGKTATLRRLHQDLLRDISTHKLLPVYIDCKHFRILDERSIKDNAGAEGLARRLLEKILYVLTQVFDRIVARLSDDTRTSNLAHYLSSFNAELLRKKLEPAALAIIDQVFSDNQAIDVTSVQAAIGKFLRPLKIQAVVLILDDFTGISTIIDVQPHLLGMLKPLLSGTRGLVCLKLAATPHDLRLSDSSVGLLATRDVQVMKLDRYIDLELDRNIDRRNQLATLLFRHLQHRVAPFRDAVARLESITVDDPTWRVLFSDGALNELILASHGNPRDVLWLMHYAYFSFLNDCDRSKTRLDTSDIWFGIKTFFNENKRRELRPEPFANDVLLCIQRLLHDRPRRVLAFRHKDLERVDHKQAVDLLERARVLHAIELDWSPRRRGRHPERFSLYAIDHALAVDATLHARAVPIAGNASMIDEERLRDLQRTLRKTSNLDETSFLPFAFPPHLTATRTLESRVCLKCEHRFSSSHPIFQKYAVCPECASKEVT